MFLSLLSSMTLRFYGNYGENGINEYFPSKKENPETLLQRNGQARKG